MYTDDLWDQWSSQEEQNYKKVLSRDGTTKRKYFKKGYLHFDLRFWFPERKEEIKTILQNRLRVFNKAHQREEWYGFRPFLKMLLKTPRYKYQEEEEYELETKIRPICFAAHVDSLLIGFYAFALNKKYEQYLASTGCHNCVLAYRTDLNGKCNIQFSKEIFQEIRHRGPCTVIALDIKGYFDHIDHRILKEMWRKVIGGPLPDDQLKLFKAHTAYSYVTKNGILKKYGIRLKKLEDPPITLLDLVPGNKDYLKFDQLRKDNLIVSNDRANQKSKRMMGIPQGSPMSALLSNIYLVDYDKHMQDKSQCENFLYRRYCDDIVIICESTQSEQLKKYAIDLICNEYFLTIQLRKVEMTDFNYNSSGKIRAFNKKKIAEKGVTLNAGNEKYYYKSLQYLGFEFNGQDIFIRSSSLSRYYRKMKSRIIKTVSMALSTHAAKGKLWKEQLFHRYTHLGKRNFIKYAYNAAKAHYSNAAGIVQEGMDSAAIKRQLRNHFMILINKLHRAYSDRAKWKAQIRVEKNNSKK